MASGTKLSASRATVQPPASLLTVLRFRISAYLLNRLIYWGLRVVYWWQAKFWTARAPTTVKHYAVRPGLEVRIFVPQSRKNANAKLPVFFLLHGGGWVIGDPRMDDEQAHLLAHKYGFCVASLEYGLSPGSCFPAPVYDCLALIKAVLADSSLPIDRSRVVLGGFSAGAAMTLSLAQLPDLKDVLKAIVAFYPVTNFTIRDRGPVIVAPWGRKEFVQARMPLYEWAYIPAGHDLRDPLLSPHFARRDEIPQPLFMITASADCLHVEAQEMACRLGGVERGSKTAASDSWEQNGVRYRRVPDMPHCFTHFFERIKDPVWEARRVKINEEVWDEVNDWVKKVLG
jgi:acetyl esterase/lipase